MQHPDDGARVTPGDRTPNSPHPAEGTIHAWLDDELSAAEADVLRAHLEQCAYCRAAVAEARGLVAASARIVRALDDGPGGVGARPMAPSTMLPPSTTAVGGLAGSPDRPGTLAPAAAVADHGIRSIGEARPGRASGASAAGGKRQWRVPAIAAVGLLAVGTTVVMRLNGPIAPLTAETSSQQSPSVVAVPGDSVGTRESLAASVIDSVALEPAGGMAVSAKGAAEAAETDPDRPTAPPVAVPPRPPQSSDLAVATGEVVADSAALRARSTLASPLQGYAADTAKAARVRVAGAPAPLPAPAAAAEASRPVVREVGPVLVGRVLTADGEPVDQAKVTLAGTGRVAAVTDGAGRFRLGELPAGEQVAVVRRLGFEPARLPLRVSATGDSVVTVALERSVLALDAAVATGVAATSRAPRTAAESSARRLVAAQTSAPSITSPPASPAAVAGSPVPPSAPVPPPQQQQRVAAKGARPAVASPAARRLAGCYRLEIGGAASADRDSAEVALPGWLRLLPTAAAGRPGWLSVEPLLTTSRDVAQSAGWRVDSQENVEIAWPATAEGREVVLRLRGSGEVLTGTAALRTVGEEASGAEREAASVVAVRGICAR